MLAATGRRKRARRPRFYSTQYREYDPALGRFHAIDIAANLYNSWTPYQYAANNPAFFNDPKGDRVSLMRVMKERNYVVPWDRTEVAKDPGGYGVYSEGGWGTRESVENNNKYSPDSQPIHFRGRYGYFVTTHMDWYNEEGELTDSYVTGVRFEEETGGDNTKHAGYTPPPRTLPGFPDAKPAKRKSKRKRWKLPNGDILEWDGLHGELERYNPRGKHVGVWDPEGNQTGDPIPGRRIDPIVNSPNPKSDPWYAPSSETVEDILVGGVVLVGVGIIIFDIVTIPSGEGMIGVLMIKGVIGQ
ncbi:colicin E3/pyocin S6 family cytotoxin [Roseivirga sp. BDSF3-8]|uniref:colicin E3/pyocin S6 family cytotoxin n=1 Tax=Roseivirga sp. BDSF3-8 TaxID=3241598 RepID=UPI0035327B73